VLTLVPALLLASAMTACGQTGSLYLPDESIESPVEIRTAPAPAPEPAPPPSSVPQSDPDEKDEEDDNTKPPDG
jgi:predicted small lipoprotein YifL